MRIAETLLIAVMLLAAPAVVAQEDGPAEESTWGRCVAQDNNRDGNDASNGTVDNTSAFENLTEEDCENASAPWENANNSSNVPSDIGPGDNPGDGDHPGQDDDPGEGDDGSGNQDDHPDEDDNPGQDGEDNSDR